MNDELQAPSGGSLESGHETTSETEPATLQKSSRMPKKLNHDPFERDVMNILKSNVEATRANVQDPDEMFLLSQLPVIQKLSQSDKMDFQIKFIQLLQSYNQPRSFCNPPVYNQDSSNQSSSRTQLSTPISDVDEESVLSVFNFKIIK